VACDEESTEGGGGGWTEQPLRVELTETINLFSFKFERGGERFGKGGDVRQRSGVGIGGGVEEENEEGVENFAWGGGHCRRCGRGVAAKRIESSRTPPQKAARRPFSF
jgi:hypothetical protein